VTTYNPRWLPATRRWYKTYEASEAARALRDEDMPTVRLYAILMDHHDRLMAVLDTQTGMEEARTFRSLRGLFGQMHAIATALGMFPAGRLRLGIETNMPEAPGARLDAFIRSGRG
jgi:hypothetical protein